MWEVRTADERKERADVSSRVASVIYWVAAELGGNGQGIGGMGVVDIRALDV